MRKDISNQKFGKLKVIKYSHTHIQPSGQKKAVWLCKCECGNEIQVVGTNLKKENGTVSCGCHKKEYIKQIGLNNFKHNKRKTPEYISWYGMKVRCNNKNTKYYKHYGGRGIQVCERWRTSFINFLNDMGERPKGTTLDRINVNGNYEPSNCRWAIPKEQANNRRK